jgi:hypothetical protein
MASPSTENGLILDNTENRINCLLVHATDDPYEAQTHCPVHKVPAQPEIEVFFADLRVGIVASAVLGSGAQLTSQLWSWCLCVSSKGLVHRRIAHAIRTYASDLWYSAPEELSIVP